MSDYIEAYLKLEEALVAYLKYLQAIPANPLVDVPIYRGHGDQNLDGISTYISINAGRSDTQPFWASGMELVEVRTMIQSQADDIPIAVHNRRVGGIRAAFSLTNLLAMRTFINPPAEGPDTRLVKGFQLTGWTALNPPIEDGFSDKNERQCLFRHRAQCGLMN
jgi:hypothetical protein